MLCFPVILLIVLQYYRSSYRNLIKVAFLASYSACNPLSLSRHYSLYVIIVRIVLKIYVNLPFFIFPNCLYPKPFEIFSKNLLLYVYGCFACMFFVSCARTTQRLQKREPELELEMAVSGPTVLGTEPRPSGRAARYSTSSPTRHFLTHS